MRTQMSDLSDRFMDFANGIVNWILDTCEVVCDLTLDFLGRLLELVIALLQLGFQILCFLRDLCIEAIQTFLNVFRGIVNLISSIKCEDVEDFAAACMVVFLWIVAVKLILNILEKRTGSLRSPINFFQATSSPVTSQRSLPNPPSKVPTRKKPRVQTRKKIGGRRLAKSSASSSSCRSCD